MPPLNFRRIDLQLTVRPDRKGGATALLGRLGQLEAHPIPVERIAEWQALPPGAPIEGLDRLFPFARPLRDLTEELAVRAKSLGPLERNLARIVLEIHDHRLDGLEWEQSLTQAVQPWVPNQRIPLILRVSPVPARSGLLPMTLPIRILEVDPPGIPLVASHVRDLFGNHSRAMVREAIQVEACSREHIESWRGRSRWPTAEVLHFHEWPFPEAPRRALSTATPETPGTLGWLSRLADTWQTRLIVLPCRTPAQAVVARRLAAVLLGRGGPAVFAPGMPLQDFRSFYYNLIHDYPLDFAVLDDFHSQGASSLFAGACREDQLRSSTLGIKLIQLGEHLAGRAPPPLSSKEALPGLMEDIGRHIGIDVPTGRDPKTTIHEMRHTLESLKAEWGGFTFHEHEREGLLPLSRKLRDLRNTIGSSGPVPRTNFSTSVPGPRFVNSTFSTLEEDGSLVEIPQQGSSLTINRPYQLGLQIGPKNEQVRIVGEMALLEEVFKWTPKMAGVWLEIALTGLDFEVLGEPVQELWLPKEGPSEPLYFTVLPMKPEISRIRFCLYYRQNLLQSFKVAARVIQGGKPEPLPKDWIRRMARALRLSEVDASGAGYLARLEYSLLPQTAKEVAALPERALSITANDNDGDAVFSIKGSDLYHVRTNANLPAFVEFVRQTLQDVSTLKTPPDRPDLWIYRFGNPNDRNAGDPPLLKESLGKLANAGWQLYDAIVDADAREEIARKLGQENQTIHIAHILLEKVIPWAAIYDRKYDGNRQDDGAGGPVDFDACLAPIPTTGGGPPATTCGVHAECPLNPVHAARRSQAGKPALLPDTVACPLGFWGFRQVIEIPPHQVESVDRGTPRRDRVLASGSAKATVCYHSGLQLVPQHLQDLASLMSPPLPAALKSQSGHRGDILKNLEDPELDLVYFFCHTRGGKGIPAVFPPVLEVQAQNQSVPSRITSAQLHHTSPWPHHPLVFLNGCNTAGFSPEALSPFVTKLVRDRGAAGVVGTEIPIFETLAAEMALLFLKDFLSGRPAGRALLDARRALLARGNPMGLAYTLYAIADLSLSTGS